MTAFYFDPANYGSAVAALLAEPRLMELGPGTPVTRVREQIASLSLPPTCQAGLWLYFDFLDESHRISQDDEADPDRNYWHAIMHRREPDPSNSKYWWRRVGAPPNPGTARAEAPRIGHRYTTPFDFVDFCEHVRGTNTADEEQARQVQLLEWQLLFAFCYQKAVGPGRPITD